MMMIPVEYAVSGVIPNSLFCLIAPVKMMKIRYSKDPERSLADE